MSNKQCKCEIPNTDLSGRCFKCCDYVTIPTHNTQLPAEVVEEIKYEAEEKAEQFFKQLQTDNPTGDYFDHLSKQTGYRRGYGACATAYAIKLHQAQQEIESLKRWKEGAGVLLEKVIHRHEGGLLPDRLLYLEFKTFLDGTK